MGEAAALVSRVSRLRRSRASALPLQDLKKKRDCSQSTRMAWLPRNSSIHATCSNLICCKRGLIRGWWNGQYSFTTRFSAMFKKNCTFFSPVCGILKLENLGDLLYLLNDAGEKNWWLISEESNATLHLSIRGDKTYKIQRSCKHKPTNILSFFYLAGALPGRNFYSPL